MPWNRLGPKKAFQERCDRLLNALTPGRVIELFGTELKDPTRRLQELLDGRQHLIDVKTVVYGESYRRAEASTAAHVNWRQAEVTKDYARKARECDAAVPGDAAAFRLAFCLAFAGSTHPWRHGTHS